MQTHLFYDLETSGLSKSFDQILQFAAIRTDQDFNEIERYSTYVKLRPDVLYSPEAIITTRISIADTMAGITEYEAAQKIHQLVNQPGTVSTGYNTLSFDDEFLRFTFFRNLLPVYDHQFRNGCARLDILPVTLFTYLYANDTLQWPAKPDGKTSLRLEDISTLNSLAQGQAHDALVDVEATIALAKKLKTNPQIWNYVTQNFDPDTDAQRLANLPNCFENEKWGIYTQNKIGSDNVYSAPVILLGHNPNYQKQSYWLRLDRQELTQTEPDTIPENTWMIKKKNGEPGFILPPENRFLEKISSERLTIIENNIKWLRDHPEILTAIKAHYLEHQLEPIDNLDPDAALYQVGFPSKHDENQSRIFHTLPHDQKANQALKFESETWKRLAIRLMTRNFPEHCPDTWIQKFNEHIRYIHTYGHQLLDFTGKPHRNAQQLLESIEQLPKEKPLDDQQKSLLNELQKHLSANIS